MLETVPGGVKVVVTPDPADTSALDGANVILGDPTDESMLTDCDIGADSVVGSRDSARDALAVVAAKNVDPSGRVVATRDVGKLYSVDADEVINPRTVANRLLDRCDPGIS